jgi:hypothetical protein
MSVRDSNPNESLNVPADDPEGTYYYLAGESDARTEFIADLHSLAGYLAANPEVPVPRYGCRILVVASGTDEEKTSQVVAVSRLLDVQPPDNEEADDRYEVVRSFGSIEYKFFGTPADQMARFQAWRSYADAVEPEGPAPSAHLAGQAFPVLEVGTASPVPPSDDHQPARSTPRTRRGKTP